MQSTRSGLKEQKWFIVGALIAAVGAAAAVVRLIMAFVAGTVICPEQNRVLGLMLYQAELSDGNLARTLVCFLQATLQLSRRRTYYVRTSETEKG